MNGGNHNGNFANVLRALWRKTIADARFVFFLSYTAHLQRGEK